MRVDHGQHLLGDTRERKHPAPADAQPQTRCGPLVVGDQHGPARVLRLAKVGRRHLPSTAAPPVAQVRGVLVGKLHRHSGGVTHRLAGEVVLGGADAPGDDQSVRACRNLTDGGGDAIEVVPHHGLAVVIQPGLGEALADVGGVAVHDLAEQQLGAHRKDLDVHPTTSPASSDPYDAVMRARSHSPERPRSSRITPSISGASR